MIDVRSSKQTSNIADQEVNFVHSSVKEYLSESLDIHFPALHGAKVAGIAGNNDLLAQKCLRYLCYEDFRQSSPSTKESFDDKIEKCAFLRYAATQWDVHASRALPLSSNTITMSNRLHDPSGSSYRLYSEVKCNVEASETFTETLIYFADKWPAPLYFASYSGVVETVSYLLDQGANIDGVCGTYHTALQYAARRGNVEVFELLLHRGADPFIKGGYHGSALNAAADPEAGLPDAAESMVSMLLAKGVDIEARDDHGWTPLHYAAGSRGYFIFSNILMNLLRYRCLRRYDQEFRYIARLLQFYRKNILAMLVEAGSVLWASSMIVWLPSCGLKHQTRIVADLCYLELSHHIKSTDHDTRVDEDCATSA